MARIDAAAITAHRQWVSPADIVDAALASTGPLVADRRLHIVTDGETEVFLDPRLTSSAFAHLRRECRALLAARRADRHHRAQRPLTACA